MKSLKNCPKGFTLVELMIAVAILLVIVVGLISMFKSSLKDQVSARSESWAVDIMVEKMSELRSSVTSGDTLPIGPISPCTIPAGNISYTLGGDISDSGGWKYVEVTVDWQEAGNTRSKSMTTYIKD
ncbi:MAG: prepilin-type N-terminal cleavage/methylation domain-containing protein [Pseudomonadota bacterium]